MKTPIHTRLPKTQGKRDARRGYRPKQVNRHYLDGYSKEYAKAEILSGLMPF